MLSINYLHASRNTGNNRELLVMHKALFISKQSHKKFNRLTHIQANALLRISYTS